MFGLPTPSGSREKDDRATIFGWCIYDWANSAYITTAVGLLPIYFASAIVGVHGATIFGRTYRADTLWGFAVGLAGAISFLCAPVLGAIADFSASKKKFLTAFGYSGALFCVLLFFTHTGDIVKTLLLFLLSQVGFVNGNVFYDAFLPHVASEAKMDDVSGKGYAYGYVGGGLQFAIALVLVSLHAKLGLSSELAARIGIATAGVWWAGFTIYCMRFLSEAPATTALPEELRSHPRWVAFLSLGISRTYRTARRAFRFKHLIIFLLAYMTYNEGIQTVINMATIYGANELHLPASALMFTLLIIQFVAVFGSLGFSKLADRFGTRKAIIFGLLIWSAVVIYAYFIHSTKEFFALGMIVGLTLGGTQALSRSYYGSMVPEEASAEFFGFYTVFSKFSAIWGPWAFAVITYFSHSARTAIVSLIAFFIVGLTLLLCVDEEKARAARTLCAF